MLVRKPEERDHLEGISVDGMIILKFILKIGCEGVDWTQLVASSEHVMNLQTP
jgi:hypothetical protein